MSAERDSFQLEKYDEKIKVMLLGDSNVGKTSIIKRFCKNEFTTSFIATIGLDFETKYIKINKRIINMQIWDTAGQERYKVLAKNYYNQSDGFIIVYDITDIKTFNSVANWIEQIKEIANDNVKSILIGNKSDLENSRVISTEEGKELAKKYNIDFYETSAQKGNNIDIVFDSLAKKILQDPYFQRTESEASSQLSRRKLNVKDKKKCC